MIDKSMISQYEESDAGKEDSNRLFGPEQGYIRPSELYPESVSAYQISTVDFLTKRYPYIWEHLSDMFEIFDVGDGSSKMRVLKKKSRGVSSIV